MAYILTDADLPENPLARTMDELIPRLLGSDRAEITGFFKITDDGGDIWIFGSNSALRVIGDTLYPYRYFAPVKTPKLSDMLASAAKAAARTAERALAGSAVRASKEVVDQRMAVCAACPHFSNGRCMDIIVEPEERDASGAVTKQAVIEKGCGCNVRVKTTLTAEACPRGKWAAVSAGA